MHSFTTSRRVIAQRCPIPIVGYGTRVAGRLGQPQALKVALSFCRLFGQDVLKTSFRKNSDSPQKFEMAVFARMHEIFAETNGGLKWLDAPEHKRLLAKKAAELELDTPEKRLAFFKACIER
jgi:tRNA uridine 5-carbamoylmethylation protein Kti12